MKVEDSFFFRVSISGNPPLFSRPVCFSTGKLIGVALFFSDKVARIPLPCQHGTELLLFFFLKFVFLMDGSRTAFPFKPKRSWAFFFLPGDVFFFFFSLLFRRFSEFLEIFPPPLAMVPFFFCDDSLLN